MFYDLWCNCVMRHWNFCHCFIVREKRQRWEDIIRWKFGDKWNITQTQSTKCNHWRSWKFQQVISTEIVKSVKGTRGHKYLQKRENKPIQAYVRDFRCWLVDQHRLTKKFKASHRKGDNAIVSCERSMMRRSTTKLGKSCLISQQMVAWQQRWWYGSEPGNCRTWQCLYCRSLDVGWWWWTLPGRPDPGCCCTPPLSHRCSNRAQVQGKPLCQLRQHFHRHPRSNLHHHHLLRHRVAGKIRMVKKSVSTQIWTLPLHKGRLGLNDGDLGNGRCWVAFGNPEIRRHQHCCCCCCCWTIHIGQASYWLWV